MKRILTLWIALIMMLSIVGCGMQAEPPTKEEEPFYDYTSDSIAFNYNKDKWDVEAPTRSGNGDFNMVICGKENGEINYDNFIVISFARKKEAEYRTKVTEVNELEETEETISTLPDGSTVNKVSYNEDGYVNEIILKHTNNGEIVFYIGYSESDEIAESLNEIINSAIITHDFSGEYAEGYEYLVETNIQKGSLFVPMYIMPAGLNLSKEAYISSAQKGLMLTGMIIEKENDALIRATSELVESYNDEVANLTFEVDDKKTTENAESNIVHCYDGENETKTFAVMIKDASDDYYLIIEIVANNLYDEANYEELAIYNELMKAYGF